MTTTLNGTISTTNYDDISHSLEGKFSLASDLFRWATYILHLNTLKTSRKDAKITISKYNQDHSELFLTLDCTFIYINNGMVQIFSNSDDLAYGLEESQLLKFHSFCLQRQTMERIINSN